VSDINAQMRYCSSAEGKVRNSSAVWLDLSKPQPEIYLRGTFSCSSLEERRSQLSGPSVDGLLFLHGLK